jgi:predicted nucleotidyltransferase
MLKIEKKDYQILKQILSKYPYHFYAYGSRVKGTARKFSDLDLCYQEEIPLEIICQIKEELEESDLPFIVELVSWKQMRPEFQKLIREDLTAL